MSYGVEILGELRRRGVAITVEGETINLNPRRVLDANLLVRIRQHKPEILVVLSRSADNRTLPETSPLPSHSPGRQDRALHKDDQREKAQAAPDTPACFGSPKCASCYSVGVIDGRERFIHPPKSSEEWREWLRKWEPKGGRAQ